MRNTILLSVIATAAIGLTSCGKLRPLTADNVVVTPTPLEAVGAEVPATISTTFPQKYLKKNIVMRVTPVLKYEGGEIASAATTFQGEKVQGNATTVPYAAGGNYTLRATFPYSDALQQSDLYLRFDARKGSKHYDLPDVKVGYGVVSTAGLLAATIKSATPATATDAYQRIIRQKQEAQIKYLVNQANVRASELNTTSIRDFAKILKEISAQQQMQLRNIEVSAYASPEGRYDFNERLAEQRQNTSSAYVRDQLRDNNLQTNVDTHYTAEDWEGFQQLVAESNIQDKEVILRVLSMYKDPVEREQQIRNMSVVYEELADAVLPELRRARLIANYEVIGRSDTEIVEQYNTDASKLGIEELLYGAALQRTDELQRQWYERATQLYPTDARAYNNLAKLAMRAGDTATAESYLYKARQLDPNSPEAATNLALIALANGKLDDAEAALAKGAKANTYGEVLGNLNLAKGNYSAAASNLADAATNSAALAQILNKDYAAAAATLAGVDAPDAYTAYLSAVLAARQGDADGVVSHLQSAIQQDATLAERARRDLEFARYVTLIAELLQ